jgi:hypothetical protein
MSPSIEASGGGPAAGDGGAISAVRGGWVVGGAGWEEDGEAEG